VLALLLVQDAAPDPSVFLNYGALGAITVILVVFARAAYKRESERADAANSEVARLNQVIQDRYLTALTETNTALTETNRILAELRAAGVRKSPGR
jgi:hypothetical protein